MWGTGALELAVKGKWRRGRDHFDKGLVLGGRFSEHVKNCWGGMCERLEWGDSGTGVSVNRERGETSHGSFRGHNRVWSGKTDESGNGEGKRWITGWEKIAGWRVRTKRVVSPSKESGIALRVIRNVNWEGHTHLSSSVPKYL